MQFRSHIGWQAEFESVARAALLNVQVNRAANRRAGNGCVFQVRDLWSDTDALEARLDRLDSHEAARDQIGGRRAPGMIPILIWFVHIVPRFERRWK